MPTIVLQLADGTAFFVGLGLFFGCLSGLLLTSVERRWLGYAWRLGAVAALALTAMAMPPLPAPLVSLWLWGAPASLLALFLCHGVERLAILVRILGLLLLGLAGLLGILELPFHRTPPLTVKKGQTVYVVADSLSAGIGTGETVWPELLRQQYGLKVVNLAVPGAQAGDALQQAEKIQEPGALVLLEIGGNDFLMKNPAGKYRDDLDRLLTALHAKGAQVAMFELPLPCFGNDFGRIQRQLARQHGVILLPRHYLSQPLGLEGGTVDGLHLSQRSHALLAKSVAELLSSERTP